MSKDYRNRHHPPHDVLHRFLHCVQATKNCFDEKAFQLRPTIHEKGDPPERPTAPSKPDEGWILLFLGMTN